MSKDSHPSLIDFLKHFEENKAAVAEKQTSSVAEKQTSSVSLGKEEVPENIISKNDRIRGSVNLEELITKYNYDIKDIFFKITAKLENYNFEFTPIILYLILGEGRSNYIICIYNLKMKDKKDKMILECNIPYYVSNGLTNHLRANLLFPFICFNLEETKEECPFYTGNYLTKGGLFKYNVINNMNFRFIKKDINESFDDSYMSKLIKDSQNERVGILSVIDRLHNLIDFLICLNNNNIINYEEKNIIKYHPITDNFLDELNMNATVNPLLYNDYEDYYKKILLMVLKRLITNFKKLDIVTFEQIDLKLEKDNIITKSFFNKYSNNPKICNNHKVSDEASKNVYNYGLISQNFGSEIEKMLEVFVGIEPKSENGQFASEFMDLIKIPEYLEKDILTDQIEKWKAKCYKKYLKYKSKYFKLKQIINK